MYGDGDRDVSGGGGAVRTGTYPFLVEPRWCMMMT